MMESGSSAPNRAATSIPAAFLARLREITGCASGALDLHGLAAARAEGSWSEAMQRAANESGLDAQPADLSLPDALAMARPDAPLVSWHPTHGWLILASDRRGRAFLELESGVSERVDVGTLRSLLGIDAADEVTTWLLIRVGLPSRSGGERPSPFTRLVEIVRPEREDILAIFLYAVFIGLLSLAIPIAVQLLVNSVAFGGLVQPVVVLALLLFVGLTFAGSLTAIQAYVAEVLQRRIFVRACVQLAERLPRVPLGSFGLRHGPEQVNRFFDLITLHKTGARLLLEGSAVVLQTAAGLLILSFYHPLMLALSIVLLSAMGFVVFGLGRGATPTAIGESSAKYALADWMEELVRNTAIFRSVSGRVFARARADALATNWISARSRHYRIVLRQLVGALSLQVAVNTGVLALGGFLVVTGELTLGQLVASEIIVAAVVASFARLGKQLESYYDLLAAVDKVGTLFDLPVERPLGTRASALEEPVRIDAVGLDFAFDGRSVLGGVDFAIDAGEQVAIEGAPGSGKSILVDLVCALRTPSAGRVEVGGADARELRLEDLRERLLCIREPEVFAGTVFENLQVARQGATGDEISEALERVGLLAEIRALPDGIDTLLSTEGEPLSRSQIARLAFARAFIARPALLAIDGELPWISGASRERLLDALFDETRPFTLIVVSPQADVAARCDRTIELVDPRRPRLLATSDESVRA